MKSYFKRFRIWRKFKRIATRVERRQLNRETEANWR